MPACDMTFLRLTSSSVERYFCFKTTNLFLFVSHKGKCRSVTAVLLIPFALLFSHPSSVAEVTCLIFLHASPHYHMEIWLCISWRTSVFTCAQYMFAAGSTQFQFCWCWQNRLKNGRPYLCLTDKWFFLMLQLFVSVALFRQLSAL